MKKSFLNIVSLILLLLFGSSVGLHAQEGRSTVLFNGDWQFYKCESDTAIASLRKTAVQWRSVQLPHDWSIEGPFSDQWASGTGFSPGGIGWYRKSFTLEPRGNKKTFIYFDGVYQNSEVWINGHFLGKRPSGVISFQYELSKYLKSTGENEILVRVDHAKFGDSRWYVGSGIYRNVYLITKNPVNIDLWGVAFTTPHVTAAKADAQVRVSIVNTTKPGTSIAVKTKLIDGNGKIVGDSSQEISIGNGDTTVAELQFAVNNPQLWSVEQPNLYKLVVSLYQEGQIVDELEQRVGIREFRFDANDGFFLNGKNMKIKGVCLHDDAGVLGVAVPKEVWVRRLKIMKAAGANAIRMAHNPHADYFYELCDEMGFLVQDENFDEWEGAKNKWIVGWNKGKPGKDGPHEYFKEWAIRDISDMVRRDRNHPSIIMWSIGNEIDYPGDPYIDPDKKSSPEHPSATRLGEVSKMLVAAIKTLDDSRPVTAALAGVGMSNKTSYPDNLDIVGYNYQESRYEADHKNYPNRIIYGSENSKKLESWEAVEKNPFISGQFLWTGIDHLGEAHNWPEHASKNGMVTMAGFPKAEFFFRQSLWLDTPMIQISTADIPSAKNPNPYPKEGQPNWNYVEGETKRVNCFTNCIEAELFINGRSLGRKKLSEFKSRVITWDVDFQPGELTVKGYTKDGKTIRHSLKTANVASKIQLVSDTKNLESINAVAHVFINIVDKKSIPVFRAVEEVTVTVTGGGRLLGLENGALDSMERYDSPTKKVLNGKLLAYIQRTGKDPIKISVKSDGLKSANLVIR